MKSRYIDFLRRLLLFSAVVAVVVMILRFAGPARFFSPALPFLLFFFLSTTLLSYYFILRSMEQKFIRFVNTYLLTIIVKLVVYIALIFVYVFRFRSDAVAFLGGFFIMYLAYTVFEVIIIVNETRRPKNGTNAGTS